MHTYIPKCMHVSTHTNAHTRIHIHTHNIHMHAHSDTQHTHTTHTCMHAHTHVHTSKHTHVRTHAHTYAHYCISHFNIIWYKGSIHIYNTTETYKSLSQRWYNLASISEKHRIMAGTIEKTRCQNMYLYDPPNKRWNILAAKNQGANKLACVVKNMKLVH